MMKPKCKTRHSFTYYGGEAKCTKCGWFLQPGGRVTRTASGRAKRKKGKGR